MLLDKFLKYTILKIVFTIFILVISYHPVCSQKVTLEKKTVLMGSVFQFLIVANDTITANCGINEAISEIERIENLISEWRPQTQVSKINANAGIKPVVVDLELFNLIKRAIEYSEITNGAFDITIAAMDKVWQFDGSMTTMPSEESIKNSIKNVGYKKIILDSVNQTIFLNNKGMKIGFGSIGKAYAADKAREELKKKYISGMVNASGDITTWGNQTNNKPWKVGIKNPFKKHGIAKVLKLKNTSVTTSGSYEKYAEIDNKRFSHIINPKTGLPSVGLTSVTVYGPSAEIANALSTSIMVLGKKNSKQLVKKFSDYRFVFITDYGRIIKK